ncbi:MAG: carboxypeptidase-like regulatory domain-containing protein [Cyclobacteriaceae bacterium]
MKSFPLRIALLCLVMLCVRSVVCAQEIIVSGILIDAESLEDLPGVHVYLQPHTGTVSDINGRFSLSVHQLDTLHFTSVGYDSLSLIVDGDDELLVSMKRSIVRLDAVEVKGLYQANTILKKPERKPMKVPGIRYPEHKAEEDYHMGLGALASPMTAIYRLFSKSYKEEKKYYQLQKKNKKENIEFEQASDKLTQVLKLLNIYLDEYYYRDFFHVSGISTGYICRSNTYDLIKVLPDAVKQYRKYQLDHAE